MKKLLSLILGLLIYGCSLDAQIDVATSTIGKIDELFQHVNDQTPGYMVGVI